MGRISLRLVLCLSAALSAVSPANDSADSAPSPRLWDTVGAPVRMNYERRILGASDSRAGQRASENPAPALVKPPASNEVFVTVDLALKERAELKDAVADLARVSGFDPMRASIPNSPPLRLCRVRRCRSRRAGSPCAAGCRPNVCPKRCVCRESFVLRCNIRGHGRKARQARRPRCS